MKVSVLLPSLYPKLAQRAIDSLRQTGCATEIEIVVCSPTKIEGQDVVWVEDADPSGNNAAIRKALAAATGDFIVSFSDDAIVAPGWLVDVLTFESGRDDHNYIVSLNHGAVGTCFGRLYANFPCATRALVEELKDDFYPCVAHWGDVSFGMAAWEKGYPTFVLPKQVAAFQADRMGAGESLHRTSSFMKDTTQFVQRFASTLGQGWPMENFRQYNLDLPITAVDDTRTINCPSRSEFIAKYLSGGKVPGDWLDGGMWVLPTHQKPEQCQKTLDAITAVGSVTKGLVWINGGDQPKEYDDLRLPSGWRVARSSANIPVCEMYRRFFKKNPNLNWYGVIADDVVPESGGWDVELVQSAGENHVSSANDGWQNGENGTKRRLHGAAVYGGNLVRTLGWLCIDGLEHNYFDDVWETFGTELGAWRYHMNLMTRHEHPWKDGKTGPVYNASLARMEKDAAVFKAWYDNRQKDYEKVRNLYSNVRSVPIDVAGKKVLFATPVHDGKPHYTYVHSLLATSMMLSNSGATFDLLFIPGESLIMRARNAIIKMFMDRDCSHLMFIDADMAWDPILVARLLTYDKDIVAVAGPRKIDPVTFCTNLEMPPRIDDRTGLLAAREVGTGFMMISRKCIEKMLAAYGPELTYKDVASGINYVALFNTRLADGFMWSEDYTFCQRWRQLGGDVWVDPYVAVSHAGDKIYGSGQTLIGAMTKASDEAKAKAKAADQTAQQRRIGAV